MSDANLLFNGDTPFSPPINPRDNPDHLFDDINSGYVYYDAWHKHCPIGSNKVLLPFIFFIDKTFVDSKGKLNSEPVTYTLGILNRNTRNNNNSAWRSMGLIPDAFMSGYQEPEDKAKDYHYILSIIFSEFYDIQHSTGIEWLLTFNGKQHLVHFIPTIHLIVTDTKAADDLVGKIQFRGTTIDTLPTRMCRFCDTPGTEIDNPHYRYNLTSSLDIQSMFTHEKFQEIKDISYRPLENAFWRLRLSDPRGINGCMPPDMLHVHLKGIDPYLRECFFDLLRLETKTRAKKIREQRHLEKNDDATRATRGSVQRPPTDEELGEKHVFTKKSKVTFESLAWAISRQLKRQSDRTLPRIHFSQGITQHFAKLTGTEETGVLLLILLCLCSTAGSTMFANEKTKATYIGVGRFSSWIGTIE
jgi:hypothetical protein